MFLVDTFTDTNGTLLASHTPDIGGTWETLGYAVASQIPGSNFIITANTGRSTGTGGGGAAQAPTHRNTVDPGADEYDVSCTMSFHVLQQAQRFHWIEVRVSPTGTSNAAVNRYLFFGNSTSTQQWELYRSVGGTLTLLDSAAAALAGNVFTVRVEVRTAGIEVFVNNVSTLSTADTTITQRGRVAIGTSRGTDVTDHWIDNLEAVAVSAGPAEGTAALGMGLELAATGSRASAGAAGFGVGLELEATGSRPSVGTAGLGIGFELAATGSRPSQGTANFVIGLSLGAFSETTPIPDLTGTVTTQGLAGIVDAQGLSGTAATQGLAGTVT